MGDSEADYLRDTVGEALAKGCLKTALAAPSDPVEYLGTWLLKFVENAKIKNKFAKDKEKAAKAKMEADLAKKTAELKAKEAAEKKEGAVSDVQKILGDPYKIWDAVAESVDALTPGCCYVANLAMPEPEEAEITEEDLEVEEIEPEEPEEEPEEGKEEEKPAEEEAAPAEEESPAEEEPVTFDYSGNFIDFVVTSKDMAYILEKGLAFHRPVVSEESEDEPPLPSAIAFDILDKAKDAIDIPNVLYEPRINYLDKFPKVGAFYALPIKSKTGEIKAILCADTLAPTGNGKPLSADSKALIKSLVDAAGQALDSTEEYFSSCDAKATAKAIKEEINQALEEFSAAPEEGAEAAEAPAEGEEAAPEPSIAVKTAALHVKKVNKISGIIASKIDKIQEDVRRYANAPPQTYGIMKALMILAGYEAEDYSTWKGIRRVFGAQLFDKIQALKFGNVSAEQYLQVRSCTKHISRDDLIAETPVSGFGLAAKFLLEEIKLAVKATLVEQIYDLATCPNEDAINFEEFVAGLPGDKDDSGALTSLKLGSSQYKDLKEQADKLAEAVAAVEKAAAEQAAAEAEAAAAVAAAEAEAAAAAEGGAEAAAEEPAAE